MLSGAILFWKNLFIYNKINLNINKMLPFYKYHRSMIKKEAKQTSLLQQLFTRTTFSSLGWNICTICFAWLKHNQSLENWNFIFILPSTISIKMVWIALLHLTRSGTTKSEYHSTLNGNLRAIQNDNTLTLLIARAKHRNENYQLITRRLIHITENQLLFVFTDKRLYWWQ